MTHDAPTVHLESLVADADGSDARGVLTSSVGEVRWVASRPSGGEWHVRAERDPDADDLSWALAQELLDAEGSREAIRRALRDARPALVTPLAPGGKSLFSGLRRLGEEDFFTELFARVLERCPALGRRLARRWAGVDGGLEWIETQVWLTPGERVDLVLVVLADDGRRILLVVESKVGAGADANQLNRYARRLDDQQARYRAREARLLLVTRDHDPVDPDVVWADLPRPVQLTQHRWHEAWSEAKAVEPAAPGAIWAQELATYMEEQGMTPTDPFDPALMRAAVMLQPALRSLESILEGPVTDRFAALAHPGTVSPPGSIKAGTLRDRGQWTLNSDIFWAWMWVGFSLREAMAHDAPDAWVGLDVNPRHPYAAAFRADLDDFRRTHPHWNVYNTDLPTLWAGADLTRSLSSFAAEPDPLGATRAWLLGALADLEAFKAAHPRWWNNGEE